MSKKARKAQRRRRRRRQLGQATPLDKLHQALGEFLTECGAVEFRMILFADLISEAPIEYIFDEVSGKTFGPKIQWFKDWCKNCEVSIEKKSRLERVYRQLDELLPKRNFLMHGETWEGAFKGEPSQPYRVGMIKKNLDYLDEFDRGEHGPNVFDAAQVRVATELCRRIRNDLDILRGASAT